MHSNSASASSTTNPFNLTDPSDLTNSTDFTAAAMSISRLVFNLIDDLLSSALLTSLILYFLDLESFAYLLLAYLFCFFNPFFLNKTVLAFLTFFFFLYPVYLAILQILYRPVEKQKRL